MLLSCPNDTIHAHGSQPGAVLGFLYSEVISKLVFKRHRAALPG